MLRWKGKFYHLRHYFAISNGENVQNWVLNPVLKFHNGTTVNKFEIVILLRQIWMFLGKRKGFASRRRENEIERKRKHKDYCQFKNCPNMSLFIARYSKPIIYSIFRYFYYFINKYSILFSIKWINQI